ncbi:MAG: CvpA family protein [Prevotellaceae bacterium]|jgi:membrane protein required for colicin V production|nr:CvpA family protein [Prevotellaceae bacterium]
MNIFDIVFVLLFCIAIYSGIKQGFIMQVAALLSLILGVYVAFKFSSMLAGWITGLGVGAQAVSIISFSLTFIGVIILARLVAHVAQRIVHIVMLGWLNRLLGAVFSLVKMSLIISVALFVINSVDREFDFMPRGQINKSKLYTPLSKLATSLLPYLDFERIESSYRDMDKRVDEKIKKIK